MSHLPPLIAHLALILTLAGIATLLFKRLNQPLILGYLLAGSAVTPSFPFFPSVDQESIAVWAEIGVLILMFALGLEFSFRKLLKVGKVGTITATVEVLSMLVVGYSCGRFLGWPVTDSLFLGGMLSMSSTTIILKAFDDLGLKGQRFTKLVFGALVVEDLLGIVMMAIVSAIVVTKLSGLELGLGLLKLGFFLVLLFMIGIFLIPTFFRKAGKYITDEVLLVISLGLCFSMVFIAVNAGLSAVLGAFIMGSILAESGRQEDIERLVGPVKDLFAAVFFVSVGMMVNVSQIVENAWPIAVITLATILGKMVFSTLGVFLSGESLKVSLQSGFALAQIGEFAFIIAGLGIGLKVLTPDVYPTIVAVSVITTFCTPFSIGLAAPVYGLLHPFVAKRQSKSSPFLPRNKSPVGEQWKRILRFFALKVAGNSVVLLGIAYGSFYFAVPFFEKRGLGMMGAIIALPLTLLAMAPFLKVLISKPLHAPEIYISLWLESRRNQVILTLLFLFRVLLALGFVMLVLEEIAHVDIWPMLGVSALVLLILYRSEWIMRQYLQLETHFLMNLNRYQHELLEQQEGKPEGKGASSPSSESEDWLDNSLLVFQFHLPEGSSAAGKTLQEAGLREKYGINVIKIFREDKTLGLPRGKDRLREGDALLVVAQMKHIRAFKRDSKKVFEQVPVMESDVLSLSLRHYILNQETKFKRKGDSILIFAPLAVEGSSSLVGHTITESDLQQTSCIVIGVERRSSLFINPEISLAFKEGDLVWILGDRDAISHKIVREMFLQKKPPPEEKPVEETAPKEPPPAKPPETSKGA